MSFDPQHPYDKLPPLPPRAEVETKAVHKQSVAASRALAELKGAGGLIPDQAVLINAIPLQEAKLSSEIENIATTQDDLFLAAIEESADTDPNTKEVLRYRTALRYGYETLASQPLSIELVRETCRILRGEPLDFRSPIRPRAKEGYSHFWFHQFIGPDFQRYLIQHSVQGAPVDRIPLPQFPNYLVLDPTVALKEAFESLVAPLWTRIHANSDQSRTLATLRDTLLPKPLSGELSVTDAEKSFEEIV